MYLVNIQKNLKVAVSPNLRALMPFRWFPRFQISPWLLEFFVSFFFSLIKNFLNNKQEYSSCPYRMVIYLFRVGYFLLQRLDFQLDHLLLPHPPDIRHNQYDTQPTICILYLQQLPLHNSLQCVLQYVLQ